MSRFDEFWDFIYDVRHYFRLVGRFFIFFLLLTILSFLLTSPGTASRAIVYLNFIIIVVMMAILWGMYAYAVRRHKRS